MKVTQVFKFKDNKKHSVIYVPENDTPENPAIASSVYISRLALPRQHVGQVKLTLEFDEPTILTPPTT